MKKLASIFLTLAMILGLSINAFAENETFTLTLTGAAGHTYDIYQIFTGDISQEGEKTVLSNVKYGQNHYPVDGQVGDSVPAAELESITGASDPVKYLDSAINDRANPFRNDVTPDENESTIEITGIPAGYYMIVDVTADLPDGQTKSPIMLQVLESVTVASKHASIVSEKKVDDKNDSNTTEDAVVWQDVADYDIGDAVPFMISSTIPSTYGTYDDYTLTFHDKQAAGFALPVIEEVYIADKNGTSKKAIPVAGDGVSGYTLHNECIKSDTCEFGGCSFTIEVGDFNEFYTGDIKYAEGDKIVVKYTSQLTGNAAIGAVGNENSMYVCHPDGHTPEDTVIVFTYELKVNKIDGATANALPGAGFTLYKKSAADNGEWHKVGDEIQGAELSTFTWSGIDDGTYKLEETTTPAGYNTMAPIEFNVITDHRVEWVKGGNSAFYDVVAKTAAGDIVFADANEDGVEDGKLEGTLENNKGAVLPETGAKGTVMLIMGGSMLAILAAVFMVTRKKMSIYED